MSGQQLAVSLFNISLVKFCNSSQVLNLLILASAIFGKKPLSSYTKIKSNITTL
jgi:hypothetical protein